ncbi:helix-turn-helix transcriptional regulator [Qingshengfaniella alkalisoli]|uniref:Helix-turn-helix domain-containing protein n=1 Tax=Qingshengfaniella alkalisoli TaxID=2599296 RepID=A0A5B8J4T4_9RHOB|nr:helix-turn-helix transcriptional regulator [Qingshengfaniella alkalisoli]QDY69547.1 helix-turn-helix domain-containing protein [Qingshengfaniella alkalisoli]
MPDTPRFLTTKEVANLLRVKERKVYDLAAADEIPHRRVTGKLLFPSADIERWIAGSQGVERPALVTGSHDLLLDWAIRASGSEMATFYDGSTDGLNRFVKGEAAMCGLHIPDRDGWNIEALEAASVTDCVLVGFARRRRGLLISPDSDIRSVGELRGRAVILRQPGAGSATFFELALVQADLAVSDLAPLPVIARTETEAAEAVAGGTAEAAIGLETLADQFNLGFVPLTIEAFDLLINRRSYFTTPVQHLLAFMRTADFAAKARTLKGYEIAAAGEVRWLSA